MDKSNINSNIPSKTSKKNNSNVSMKNIRYIRRCPYDIEAFMWGALEDGNIWYLNPSGIWVCYKPAIWIETSPGFIQPTCQKWINKSLPPLPSNPFIPPPNFNYLPQFIPHHFPHHFPPPQFIPPHFPHQLSHSYNYVDYDVYEAETPQPNVMGMFYNPNLNWGYTGEYSGEYNGEYINNQCYNTTQTDNSFNSIETENNTNLTISKSLSPSLTSIPEHGNEEDDFDYSDMPELVEVFSEN
jgi:hypothetical protein